MIIKVTANDIAKGIPTHVRECPVARALRRAGFKNVGVGRTYLTVDGGKKEISTPDNVVAFVQAFDREITRAQAVPFSFEVPWRKPVKKAKKVKKAAKKKTAKR